MSSRLGWVSLVAVSCMLFGLCRAPTVPAGDKVDSYKTVLETRIAKAEKDKDVRALVEGAFALFPIEVQGKVKDPRYAKVLGLAADLVLASKKADDAREFLELVGPLAGSLSEKSRTTLTTLALGRPLEKIVSEETERVRDTVKKRGPDIVDPEIKARGELDREMASKIGSLALLTVRPLTYYAQKKEYPRMVNYSFTFPAPKRVTIYIEMEWHGFWKETNMYKSELRLTLEADRSGYTIFPPDYTDNGFPAPDTRFLQRFVRELNKLLNG